MWRLSGLYMDPAKGAWSCWLHPPASSRGLWIPAHSLKEGLATF